MYAMQYEINLPADYDMGIIRDRVARRGAALDRFAGLRFKAYLIRERAQDEATNAYAPFYVWDDLDGMRRFLWGGVGFAGIISSFGRPPVQDWTVGSVLDGPAPAEGAVYEVLHCSTGSSTPALSPETNR
jgi:hypothetical protein